jgi:hypothetical protein
MKKESHCIKYLWINVNIVLYAGYAVFGLASFFWPTLLDSLFYIVLHLATLSVYVIIVYGLTVRRFPVNYIVAFISPFMIAHLIAFTLSPLGMELAYMGPSRSFYSFFLNVFSLAMDESSLLYSLIVFNSISVLIHVVNFFYFLRKKTALLFSLTEE